MSHQSDLIATDINEYLAQHERKELLRLLTCGSVDDGKSTLIGRLLHDSKMIYEDQLEAIKADSVKHGTTGEKFDLALLVDGLQAEREQGITIDVAYRYFSTAKRKFIIADTPGHEQYTRNMATGASTCDLAIILVDARYGVMTQTRRHSFIASLLGIKHVVVAVNKMDLKDFSEEVFNDIRRDYLEFAEELNIEDIRFVPMSALEGDNVVNRSERTSWYEGETLMELLESIQFSDDRNFEDFRLPVQYVNRPNLDFRGFCGTVASGVVKPGEEVMALPSGKISKVKSIVTYEGELDQAFAAQAITLTLEDEIDISRGDMIVKAQNKPTVANHFEADVVWMIEDPLKPGRQYDFKFSSNTTSGSLTEVLYSVDVNTMQQLPSDQLHLNEIGRCRISVNKRIAFDNYRNNRATGAFIVIDRLTNVTVGAGMISGCDDHEQTQEPVSSQERAERYDQQALLVAVQGATDAQLTLLERELFERSKVVVALTAGTASVDAAKLLRDAGLIVLLAAQSSEADLSLSLGSDDEREQALEQILAAAQR